MPQSVKVTTDILWRGAGLFAVLDLGLLLLLARWVTAARFRELRGGLLALTGVFWFCLWMVLVALVYWDRVYAYVFPAWTRWLLPVGVALLTTGAAAVALALAGRLPGRPAVSFCLLGGVWGSLTHIWAVFRGIVDKPPMLQGASPTAAVVIAFFEFTCYFGVIVIGALLVRRLRGRLTSPAADTAAYPPDTSG